MEIAELIDEHAAGPNKLRETLEGMTHQQIDAEAVPGQWSTRQVVCHLADFEPVYADRMKRAISLRTLLERSTNHIPHHVQFLAEKQQEMGL